MNLWQIFIKGVFEQNPIFRLALSLCPALAVTSTAMNATAMGVAVHAVRLNTLEFSNHVGLQWSGYAFQPFSKQKN